MANVRHHALRCTAGILALSVAAACRESPRAAPPEIRIGLLATFTGPFAGISGVPTRQGAELAVRDAAPVTIDGVPHTVVLVPQDFDDRADAAASAAQALINQQRVVAIVGPQFSRHAIPASVVAENSRVPMISPMSSNPATTASKAYVFRLAFLDNLQGTILARYALGDLRARTAAVLYDISTAYSRDIAERFRAEFISGGGRVAAFESYTADQATDFRRQIQRIRQAAPDVIFLPNFPDAVNRQVPQLQQAGILTPLLGGDSWDPQTLPPLRGRQRAFVTNQWRPDIPLEAARRFVQRYRQVWDAEPRATAAMTYDAVGMILDAIRRGGSLDPDSIRAALAATKDHTGAAGVISFDGGHDPRRAVAVSEIRGHTLHTMRLVEP
jgi:branched-chain amino acid transport system substrate-binding protein